MPGRVTRKTPESSANTPAPQRTPRTANPRPITRTRARKTSVVENGDVVTTPAATPEPTALVNAPLVAEPTTEAIQLRAYFRYLERGCVDGHSAEDWIAAEAELRRESTRN